VNTQTVNESSKIVDINSKAAPFIAHSSTGAGGAAMSANSPMYQNGRYQI
jgi:hypothetical protein